mmetsp:Transcript_93532/g.260436  ORF Transcript_93532/g.260436 Transcript_93532/m.260436 type:complete len:283 (+) Transcript_93532:71-919(+)
MDLACMIEFGDHRYAALDSTSPHCTSIGTQQDFKDVPLGWEVAPNDPCIVEQVIEKYHWGTHVLVVRDGTGYWTAGTRARGQCSRDDLLETKGMSMKPKSSNMRVLMRTATRITAAGRCQALTNRMWALRRFPDCEVVCAQEVIPCHRAVLAGASPVFDRMLSSNMLEGERRQILVGDSEPKAVQAMLEFVYTGQVTSDTRGVALLYLADCYQIGALVAYSAEQALQDLSADTVAEVVCAFRSLQERPEMKDMWSQLAQRVRSDAGLFDACLMHVEKRRRVG